MSENNHINIHIASDRDMNLALSMPSPSLDTASIRRPSSIHALSKTLRRNYKNVHSDIKLLREADLIRLDDNDKIFVPWQKIHTEIDLLAAA